MKQIQITSLDGRTMSVCTDKEWTEDKDYFEYIEEIMDDELED